jgi:hypothetical protein
VARARHVLARAKCQTCASACHVPDMC